MDRKVALLVSCSDWLKGDLFRRIEEFWHAKVVLVTITKPYFRVARLDPSSDGCLFEPLEAEQDFNITQLDLNQFEPLVRRFLVNGSATHRKAPRPDSPDSAQRQFDLG
ncbi:MAG TPA: hypothetical protein VE616_04525 [Candidatus Udaeobacter sp.]|nr:hypothetical protein [Candidatus Udaeobacter sp.]